ncbi:hypothetical protein [Allobranchiibius sp. CTAmp26]|nr:hypothetical protein [Allobranchiibius sp. CTAmp26]MBO1756514.1 hypothetical protein [Allobranchiibius sp. CTAmp26]
MPKPYPREFREDVVRVVRGEIASLVKFTHAEDDVLPLVSVDAKARQ